MLLIRDGQYNDVILLENSRTLFGRPKIIYYNCKVYFYNVSRIIYVTTTQNVMSASWYFVYNFACLENNFSITTNRNLLPYVIHYLSIFIFTSLCFFFFFILFIFYASGIYQIYALTTISLSDDYYSVKSTFLD